MALAFRVSPLPGAPGLPRPTVRREYPGAASLIRLPLFGEIKMNQISFENGVAMLTTQRYVAATSRC